MTLPARLPGAATRPAGARPSRWWVVALLFAVGIVPRLAVAATVVVVSAAAWRWWAHRRRRRLASRSVDEDLPAVVALLQVSAAAGHGPRTAIALVGLLGWGPVAAALGRAAARLAHGASLVDALEAAVEEPGASMGWLRLVEVCSRADEDGGRWAPALDIFADDLHRERMASMEERTGRLTVALLLPLVVCILPAFVLVAIVPVVGGALIELAG